jgi:hypothetical protein
MHQLVLHSVARPAWSLVSTGDMPDEYLSGELVFPLYSPDVSSTMVHLIAPRNACLRSYFANHLRDELAHFQVRHVFFGFRHFVLE